MQNKRVFNLILLEQNTIPSIKNAKIISGEGQLLGVAYDNRVRAPVDRDLLVFDLFIQNLSFCP